MNSFKQVLLGSCLLLSVVSSAFAQTEELRIVAGELPPFTSENPEESFLTEVLQEVAREMGVTFTIIFVPWIRCECQVEQLQAWGAFPYVSNPEREQKFFFSDRLYSAQAKFFYYSPDGEKKDFSYTELQDLRPYRIGGVRGYYYVKAFEDAGIELELVTDEEQNPKKLAAGRVDFIIMNETVGWHLIKKSFPPDKVKNFGTVEKPYTEFNSCLMTSKHYPNTQGLLTRFNAALNKVKETGVYQRIIEKHGLTVRY